MNIKNNNERKDLKKGGTVAPENIQNIMEDIENEFRELDDILKGVEDSQDQQYDEFNNYSYL